MNANDIMRIWLDTWGPHCGAPRSVFEGQAKVMIGALFDEIERRAEMESEKHHTVTGMHYRALLQVRSELKVPRR